MDKYLLDTLVCPLCKNASIHNPGDHSLICTVDRLAFPIRDGMPVMLESEARRLSDDEAYDS